MKHYSQALALCPNSLRSQYGLLLAATSLARSQVSKEVCLHKDSELKEISL